jgi:hypothetical protein
MFGGQPSADDLTLAHDDFAAPLCMCDAQPTGAAQVRQQLGDRC